MEEKSEIERLLYDLAYASYLTNYKFYFNYSDYEEDVYSIQIDGENYNLYIRLLNIAKGYNENPVTVGNKYIELIIQDEIIKNIVETSNDAKREVDGLFNDIVYDINKDYKGYLQTGFDPKFSEIIYNDYKLN